MEGGIPGRGVGGFRKTRVGTLHPRDASYESRAWRCLISGLCHVQSSIKVSPSWAVLLLCAKSTTKCRHRSQTGVCPSEQMLAICVIRAEGTVSRVWTGPHVVQPSERKDLLGLLQDDAWYRATFCNLETVYKLANCLLKQRPLIYLETMLNPYVCSKLQPADASPTSQSLSCKCSSPELHKSIRTR